jgi:hypothetical protein
MSEFVLLYRDSKEARQKRMGSPERACVIAADSVWPIIEPPNACPNPAARFRVSHFRILKRVRWLQFRAS